MSEFLLIIKQLAAKEGISEPFLTGGVPRDKILGNLNNMEDLDITTGDQTIHRLAELLSSKFPNWEYKKMNDGHSSIFIGPLKLDFSSNFVIPNVENIVKRILSPLEQEMWSRDFTCNSLLLDLDLNQIKDVTGFGVYDIHKKFLRTCLDPAITLGIDSRRIIRIIYLAIKLNFTIDREIIKWVHEHPEKIANVTPEYLIKKWKKCLDLNKEKALSLAKFLKVIDYLPLHADEFLEIANG